LLQDGQAQGRAGVEALGAGLGVAFVTEIVTFLGVRVDFAGRVAQLPESSALGVVAAASTAGATSADVGVGAGTDAARELCRAGLGVADVTDLMAVLDRTGAGVGYMTQRTQDLTLE
jgi:hypothetical protein